MPLSVSESDRGRQLVFAVGIDDDDRTSAGGQTLHGGEKKDLQEPVHTDDRLGGREDLLDRNLGSLETRGRQVCYFLVQTYFSPAFMFCHLECAAGLLRKVLPVKRVCREGGDSCACGKALGAHIPYAGEQVLSQPFDYPSGEEPGVCCIAFREDDGESVPSQASDRVDLPDAVLQYGGCFLQRDIARGREKCGVVRLEAVNVERE